MVFCKLTNKLKSKLEDAEKYVEKTTTFTKDTINNHIQNHLKTIEKNKKSISDKIQSKIKEKQNLIQKTIIQPYIEQKKNNYAIGFIIDVSLSVVAGLFLYKMYPFLKNYMSRQNYTPEQFDNAKKLPETAYSKEDLRKVNEFRTSFQNWIDYYKADNAFSPDNVGLNDIQRGSVLRQPMLFIIQYVIPYVIVAYFVWFIVKYIKYVLAAIWGFFVAIYQFITEKITCKLAEKWYIRLVTGWSRCDPRFSEYVDNWKNTYISRPLAKEKIGYLRAVQKTKELYNSKYGARPPWELGLNFGFNWFGSLWDWFRNLKRIYIDLPIEELYLQLIDFHPTYVVKPYELLAKEGETKANKIKGNAYPSKTRKGKICKCPPKKTVFKKMSGYLKAVPGTKEIKSTVSNINKKIKNMKSSFAIKPNLSKKIGNIMDKLPNCENVDAIINNKKRIAQAIWTSMMLFTTSVVVYSLLYSTPGWLHGLTNPIYSFTNGYTPTPSIPILSMVIIGVYFTSFTGLGYYGFLH